MWPSFSVLIFIALTTNVIFAHHTPDHRCSHVPPTQEPVHHVWLSDVNFTTDASSVLENDHNDATIRQSRSRRTLETPARLGSSLLQSETSIQDSLWDLFRRFKGRPKSIQINDDDSVPMKIQVYYDSSVYLLNDKKQELIMETVIPSVVKFFENVLSIRRDYTIDKFRIARRCPNNTFYHARDIIGSSRSYCMDRCEDHAICGEMIVPKEHLSACSYCNTTSRRCTTNHLSEGIGVANTQLLLYVSAKQTNRCRKDQTIAYAAHCAQDVKTDRPVAGHANLCPSSISTEPKDLKALIATVKHELTHVLGFSVSLFAYYRDANGHPLTERESHSGPIPIDPKTGYAKWSENVIKKIIRHDWMTGQGPIKKEAHVIVTPTVVREVRRHFNCSTLEGAELEDQGSEGTSMTHWEKRLFENEAMTGTHTQNSVYSRITLAVLQDTGWYVANFSRADKLEWGKDLGCDFATKSCKSWINERRAKQLSIRPFCDRIKGDLLQIACTEDRSSKAVCNMRNFSEPLPTVYQNFDELEGVGPDELVHYGGSVDLADYCPFIQEFTWQAQNISVRGSRCDLGSGSLDAERNAALEHYGPEARCFEHGRRWEQRSCAYKRQWHHYGAGCYKYKCMNGHLSVLVGNHSYPCYYTDQMIHIEQIVDHWLHNGTIVCPACEKVCPGHKCKIYDKFLIDKLMSYSEDPIISNNNSREKHDEILQSLLDEAFNLVETTKDDNFAGGAYTKLFKPSKLLLSRGTLTTSNHSVVKNISEHRENFLTIIRQYEKPPKQMLLCSSAISQSNNIPNSVMLISITISFMLLINL